TLGTPHSIRWSGDDSCLLVLSRGSAWLIDAGDGALIRRFQDPAAPILAAAFRSSSEVIVASAAGTLAIEDLRTGTRREVRLRFTPMGIAGSSTGAAFAAAALQGASGDTYRVVFVAAAEYHPVALQSASGDTYRMVFGRCDEPERSTSVDLVTE